jgi:DNA polymerase-3 subunit gamma/tau
MSYQVLARKWRPNKFSELVGQEHVVTAISNALDNNRLHHAYLFSGTRGVGKTTIARIFSKSLNCEQGLGANPCGQCSTCQEIEQGNFIDLLEIDAASRTKVEDTRELLDNVQYKPSRGRYKVYLIDEVHMLSKHSFNALLKTLEEPPPHVKFLLATTDPQKLPVTILSRCLQFNLKALSRSQISQQLLHIFSQEEIDSEAEALAQLARAAQGSMRDALSLSDQAIAQGNGQVSLQIVTDMLGLMDKNQVLKLLNALLQKDAQGAMQQVEHMSFQAPDYAQVLAEIMSLLHQIALTQFVPDACKLETISARAIYQLAKTVAPEQIQLLYQIALQGKKDIAFAADGRTGLEMTMLRMLAFSPDPAPLSIDELVQKTPVGNQLKAQPLTVNPPSEHVAVAPQRLAEDHSQETVKAKLKAQGDSAEVPLPEIVVSKVDGSEVKGSEIESPKLDNPVPQYSAMDQSEVRHPESSQIGQEHIESIAPEPISADIESDTTPMQHEQDLIAQQQDIMQEAQQLYPGSPEMFDEAQADFAQQQAHFDRAAQSETIQQQSPSATSGLNTTESLLALQQKLQDSQAEQEEQEEQASQVKKSETSPSEGWMPVKQKIADSVEPTPGRQTENSIVRAESDLAKTSVSLVSAKQVAPPWDTGEPQNTAPETIPQQAIVHSPELQLNTEQALSPEPSPAFYPTAHLDEGLDCEVDFEVPAYLADGQKVVAAQQLDSWSQLIEQMQLTALTKQLALHSVYNKLDNKVTLALMDSKQHLNTDSAKEQLQKSLSSVLQQDIVLEVNMDTPVNTPFAVQQTINQVRQQYAQKVVDTDQSIALLSDTFAARAIEGSIKPR